MLRVLIVDDERLARYALAQLLESRQDVVLVGEADGVEAAVTQIAACDPDVIFLDIALPDGSGFDLFDRTQVRAHVVFVTAYGDHALRAFEVNALDYIVKPAQPGHVARALARVLGSTPSSPPPGPAEPARAQGQLAREDRVCLREPNALRFCRVYEIAFVQAADAYTEVRLQSGQVVMVYERLHTWQARLPDSFARIHRSTLVNLELVEELAKRRGSWELRLRAVAQPLAVSRRLVQGLKARLAACEPAPGR